MLFSTVFSLAFAFVLAPVASQAEGNAGTNAAARSAPRQPRDIEYRDMTTEIVKDLMSRRTLTKREQLVKRSIVTDVLNGVMDVFKSGKIDLNVPLRQGVDSLRNVSSVVDFNKAIPLGFNNAIDQNTQIQSIPFGTTVAGVAKSIVGGFDFNTLITQDGVNFLQGSLTQVNANAVAQSGLQAVINSVAV